MDTKPNQMKHWVITLLAITSFGTAFGQAYPDPTINNEVRFNMGLFLATTTIEGSYEYFINGDASIGLTAYFDSDPNDFNGDFGIGPNFRAYFGYGYANGFFAEAFGLFYTGREEVTRDFDTPVNVNYDTFALGLGIGGKWVTRSQRISFEISGGFGRNVNPEYFQDDFIYRLGLSIGFRF